jgi:hypothetical protein
MGRGHVVWKPDASQSLRDVLKEMILGYHGSLYQLELVSGVARSQLARFCDGRGHLSVRSVQQLFEAFGLKVVEVRGGRHASNLVGEIRPRGRN